MMTDKEHGEDYELTLFDRIEVIKSVIAENGEENFYISFSGGKDSMVLHHLIDLALPGNRIPRVYINTGIEYVKMVQFVRELAKRDDRIQIVNSGIAIKKMLEDKGYPFKSKEHSQYLSVYQNNKNILDSKTLKHYLRDSKQKFVCPSKLRYQFTDEFKIKISDKCCGELKKKTFEKWIKENKRPIAITGMRKQEGGNRSRIKGCVLTDKSGRITKFHPLLVVESEFEEWFLKKYEIKLCDLYYPPFNFKRTGCKGCPLALNLEEELEVMELYLPEERKQCEIIWGPVYEEYRRIGYRLKKNEQMKLF